MWTKTIRLITNDYGTIKTQIELPGIQREDGFAIFFKSSWKEGYETYICESLSGEFWFHAHRGGCMVQTAPPNVYIIESKDTDKDWPPKREQYEPLILKHAVDLKHALMNFTTPRRERLPQITEVWLNVNIPTQRELEVIEG